MDYYLGGYYLVEGLPRPPHMAAFLPDMLWSVSSCLCGIHPDTWALPWVKNAFKERASIQSQLRLTPSEFTQLQAWVDLAFSEQHFGWPHVWLDLDSAYQYYQSYLQAIPHIKLLAIALPSPYIEKFLSDNTPSPGFGVDGIYQLLSQRRKVDVSGSWHGFDVLGVEYGGSFHSFLCNHLEIEYHEQLHLEFNDHGLLTNYADAQRAADYTNLESTGAEPIPWYPWLVIEYPLPRT